MNRLECYHDSSCLSMPKYWTWRRQTLDLRPEEAHRKQIGSKDIMPHPAYLCQNTGLGVGKPFGHRPEEAYRQ